MHPCVVHIASGQAFFSGALMVLIALAVGNRCRAGWPTQMQMFAVIFGLLLAILSATPLPLLLWYAMTIGSLALLNNKIGGRAWLLPVVCMSWVTAGVVELGWQWTPELRPKLVKRELPVVVLADSVTAGLGEGEAVTWPRLLRDRQQRNVLDLSQVGETVASSLKRVQRHTLPQEAVILLELGGNDILGSTTADQFEQSLDALLTHLKSPGHRIFMFELPLPPFHNNWGRIQRDQASRHGVFLIPKHQLASVFSGRTSTLDSIHLSQQGHERMLVIVNKLLGVDNHDRR